VSHGLIGDPQITMDEAIRRAEAAEIPEIHDVAEEAIIAASRVIREAASHPEPPQPRSVVRKANFFGAGACDGGFPSTEPSASSPHQQAPADSVAAVDFMLEKQARAHRKEIARIEGKRDDAYGLLQDILAVVREIDPAVWDEACAKSRDWVPDARAWALTPAEERWEQRQQSVGLARWQAANAASAKVDAAIATTQELAARISRLDAQEVQGALGELREHRAVLREHKAEQEAAVFYAAPMPARSKFNASR